MPHKTSIKFTPAMSHSTVPPAASNRSVEHQSSESQVRVDFPDPASYPLAAEVSAALARHPYFRLRPLAVEAEEGLVVLNGVVATYYHKQVAQEMIRKIDGVEAVENRLHVTW